MREIAVAGDDSSTEFTSYRRDERVDGYELRALRTDLVRNFRCDDGPLLGDLDHLPLRKFLPCFRDVGTSTTDQPEQVFRVDGCWEDEYLLFVFFEILAGSVDLVPVVDEKRRIENLHSPPRLSATRSIRSVDVCFPCSWVRRMVSPRSVPVNAPKPANRSRSSDRSRSSTSLNDSHSRRRCSSSLFTVELTLICSSAVLISR